MSDKRLFAALETVLREQSRRWREIIEETSDKHVQVRATDALDEVERLQDALLIGHFHDAIAFSVTMETR